MRKVLAVIAAFMLQLVTLTTPAHASFTGCPDTWIPTSQDISYAKGTLVYIPPTGIPAPLDLADAVRALGRDIDVHVNEPTYSLDGVTWQSLPPTDGLRSLAIAFSGLRERLSYSVSVANCPNEAKLYYYHAFPNVVPMPQTDLHAWLADINNLRSHRLDFMNFKEIANLEDSFNSCVDSIKTNASINDGRNYSRGIFQVVGQDYQSSACGKIMNFDMTISIHDIKCVHTLGNYFTIAANQSCRVSLGWPDNGMCDGCTNTALNFATFDVQGPAPLPSRAPSSSPSPSARTTQPITSTRISVSQVGNMLIVSSSNPGVKVLINGTPGILGQNVLRDGSSMLIVEEGPNIIFQQPYSVEIE